MKIITIVISACLVTQLSSCGPKDRSSAKDSKSSAAQKIRIPKSVEVIPQDNLEILETETYLAVFEPINHKITGKVTGSFTLHKDRDFMAADVRVSGSAPNIIHAQNLHEGILCPNEYADGNQDGIIDTLEAQHFTGKIIVPLDGDINSQYSMLGTFPVADNWGSYVYGQTASFQRFIEDLRSEDENLLDNIIKIGPTSLGLAGKVVMIHGIADDVDLPGSVATQNGLTANQTLPIACGVLKPVTFIPGTFEPNDLTVGTTRSGDDTPGVTPRRGSSSNRTGRGNSPARRPRGDSDVERNSPLGNHRPCPGETTPRSDGKEC